MTARWTGRRSAAVTLVVLVLLAGLLVAMALWRDGSGGTGSREDDAGGVHGPLCDALPSGDDPGNPAELAELDAAVALTWVPVLTIFEAGTRAAGLTDELRDADGITILAPSDDAFLAAMTQDTLDELIISRQDELRGLLESHLVDEELTVAELVAAERITTRAGDTLTVAPSGSEAELGGRAVTVCGDYEVANATIHVIDGVLGELPAPAEPDEPVSG